MPHRQVVAWQEYLRLRWNEPSRSDHYVMQLNEDLIRVNSKNPRAVKPGCRRLRFEFKARTQTADQSAEAMRHAKQLWVGRVAVAGKMKPEVVEVEPDYNTVRPDAVVDGRGP